MRETFQQIFSEYDTNMVPTAVLCDYYHRDRYRSILNDLGKQTISIEDYIEQNNMLHPSQVVYDEVQYTASFEMPLVIHVGIEGSLGYDFQAYTHCSRPRSKLIIIDEDYDEKYYADYPNIRITTTEFEYYR